MALTTQIVTLQPTISGLKILKDGFPLQFEEDEDVVVIECISQDEARRIHDPRDGRHEEAFWMLVAGHSYVIRQRDSEDDIDTIMVPYPRRQELRVQQPTVRTSTYLDVLLLTLGPKPQMPGGMPAPEDKARAVRQLLMDFGFNLNKS